MSLISLFLDAGNVVFFLSNLPQLITAYRNRRNLKGLSPKMLMGFIVSTVCFVSAGYLASAPFAVILGLLNIAFFSAQLYWLRKYGNGNFGLKLKRIFCYFRGHKWGYYAFYKRERTCLRCGKIEKIVNAYEYRGREKRKR